MFAEHPHIFSRLKIARFSCCWNLRVDGSFAIPSSPRGVFVAATWWFIPLSKWVITPVISGLTPLIPFITRVVTHLRSVGWATKYNLHTLQGKILSFRGWIIITSWFDPHILHKQHSRLGKASMFGTSSPKHRGKKHTSRVTRPGKHTKKPLKMTHWVRWFTHWTIWWFAIGFCCLREAGWSSRAPQAPQGGAPVRVHA